MDSDFGSPKRPPDGNSKRSASLPKEAPNDAPNDAPPRKKRCVTKRFQFSKRLPTVAAANGKTKPAKIPHLIRSFSKTEIVPTTGLSLYQSATDALSVILAARKVTMTDVIFDDSNVKGTGGAKRYQHVNLCFVISAVIYHVFFGWTTKFEFGESLARRQHYIMEKRSKTLADYFNRTVVVFMDYIFKYLHMPFDVRYDNVFHHNILHGYKRIYGERNNYPMWSNEWLDGEVTTHNHSQMVRGHHFDWAGVFNLFMENVDRFGEKGNKSKKALEHYLTEEQGLSNEFKTHDTPRIRPKNVAIEDYTNYESEEEVEEVLEWEMEEDVCIQFSVSD
jgi:hypothetical protein